MHSVESRLLQDRKIYCLLARPGIFQPGNFTGRGSEGVNQVEQTKDAGTTQSREPLAFSRTGKDVECSTLPLLSLYAEHEAGSTIQFLYKSAAQTQIRWDDWKSASQKQICWDD